MFPFKKKKKKNEDIFEEFTFYRVSWWNYNSESPSFVKKESKMFFTKKEAEKFKNELKVILEKIGCDLLFSIEESHFSATAVKQKAKAQVFKPQKDYAKYHSSESGRRHRDNTEWARGSKRETF